MPLTDIQVKNAPLAPKEPGGKDSYTLTDENGLYLHVGKRYKSWRYNFSFQGKQQTVTFGRYPHLSLKRARQELVKAKQQLAEGINPMATRKAEKQAKQTRAKNTFQLIANEWHTKQADNWTASHHKLVGRIMARHLFPEIGARPILDIGAPDLLRALRPIEQRGTLETHRARTIASQVFRYRLVAGAC